MRERRAPEVETFPEETTPTTPPSAPSGGGGAAGGQRIGGLVTVADADEEKGSAAEAMAFEGTTAGISRVAFQTSMPVVAGGQMLANIMPASPPPVLR